MAQKKQKTNTQRLIDLIKTNDMSNPILNLLLRERIVTAMELTMADIKKNPKYWNNSLIHPRMFEILSNNVNEALDLDN